MAEVITCKPPWYMIAFDEAVPGRTSGASDVARGQSNRTRQVSPGSAKERLMVVPLEGRLSDDMHTFVTLLIACLLSGGAQAHSQKFLGEPKRRGQLTRRLLIKGYPLL